MALTRSERSDLGSKRLSSLNFELSPSLLFLFTLEALERRLDLSQKTALDPPPSARRTAHRASAVRRSPNPPKPHILLLPSSLSFPSLPTFLNVTRLLPLPSALPSLLPITSHSTLLARFRAARQHGYEPLDRVSCLQLPGGTRACVAGLELTLSSQRFNLISKSEIRYVFPISINTRCPLLIISQLRRHTSRDQPRGIHDSVGECAVIWH